MQLRIKGLMLDIVIGCYEYERTSKQKLIIDLVCEFSCSVTTDNLDETLNYAYLTKFIQNSLVDTAFNLLESVAFYLEGLLFKHFDQIKAIKLDLSKPNMATELYCEKLSIVHEAKRKVKVAIALGSNADNLPKQQIITAFEMLGEIIDDTEIGNIYLSKPVGFIPQNDFYNTAFTGYTTLSVEKLFAKIKTIEKIMGKKELCKDGPRIIDIDLLLYGDLIYNRNYIQIPHPRMHQRDFVLKPLSDIAPHLIHPRYELDIMTLLMRLDSNSISIVRKA